MNIRRSFMQKMTPLCAPVLICILGIPLTRAEEGPTESSSRRPCTGRVSLYIDETEQWDRRPKEIGEMEEVVTISDGNQQGKKGILLATLIESVPDVQAVEVSTCNGKVRLFEGEKLQAKKDSLYLVITNYRGLKLFNSAGESGRGSRLKNIDQVRLITQPE